MRYKISVIETLERVLEIDADTEQEAIDEVMRMAYEDELRLDSNDSLGYDYCVVGVDNEEITSVKEYETLMAIIPGNLIINDEDEDFEDE